MIELYILTGLITLLALAGVFAPRTMGASIRVLPEPVEEEVVFLEDLEDLVAGVVVGHDLTTWIFQSARARRRDPARSCRSGE